MEENTTTPTTTLKPYQDLVDELRAVVAQTETLQAERSAFQNEKERLSKAREQIGNSIFEARGKGNGLGTLVGKLESVEREQKVLAIQLEALAPRLTPAEAELHRLLPLAGTTFGRLRMAWLRHITEAAVAPLLELIHPSRQAVCRETVEALATNTVAVVDAASKQLPDCNGWAVTRPIIDIPGETRWTATREETIRTCITNATGLCHEVTDLFGQLANDDLAWLPAFLFGEEPPKPTETHPEWTQPLDSTSQSDEAHMRELCAAAGKDINNLSDHERLVLQNSLELHRKSRLATVTP
jgi:hypothetical protein